jgi:hypothetical protein
LSSGEVDLIEVTTIHAGNLGGPDVNLSIHDRWNCHKSAAFRKRDGWLLLADFPNQERAFSRVEVYAARDARGYVLNEFGAVKHPDDSLNES